MESLLEFRWDDPIARAVPEVLSSVPDGVDGLAHAISDLGAHVRVTRVVDEGRDAPVGR
jgi:hypothetical protein